MNIDLREIISEHFGFGDFIFRNPDTFEEVARVRNLKELQNIIFFHSEGIFALSHQPQPRLSLALLPCHVSACRVPETDYLEVFAGHRCASPDNFRSDCEVS